MKKILKKMLLRFIIFFIVIFLILFVIELCLNISNKKNTFDGWYNENIKINQMNIDKLQNKYWGDNPIWLHEGESIEDKDPNKKRILIVGDSYIWGDGYSNANHMWWQQFKHLLKEKGYGDVEVIAAGFGGYSTKKQFENIIKNEKIIKKINPDLIIIGFVNNDPEFRDENGELMVKSINTTDLYYDSDNLFINSFKKIVR